MARRRPAAVHGYLALNKPAGMTSRAALSAVCRALGERRAGHAGTLDPDATGVLVIAFGEATKSVRWLTGAPKSYVAVVAFGNETSTDDAAGAVTRTAATPKLWSEAALTTAARRELGWIKQVPPSVSALKKDGVRDHERVRRGEVVQREPRSVRLDGVELLDVARTTATFHVRCGSGFYVRAWARDLGRAMGSAAHLETLHRDTCGGFSIDESVTLDQLTTCDQLQARTHMTNLVTGLRRVLPTFEVTADVARDLQHGKRVMTDTALHDMDAECLATWDGAPVCIAGVSADKAELRVIRGFSPELIDALRVVKSP